MASKWTDETLAAARFDGDADVDPLVADVLRHVPGAEGLGRLGYNHMVDLADTLATSPELVLVPDSLLARQLAAMARRNAGVARLFDPVEAPAWVDEEKLARASALWRTDSILMLAALYAASLPACYLMMRGVPALYRTEKLADAKYVFQRIFETGTMLETVLRPGGLRIVKDVELDTDARMVDVLNKIDPGGGWTWVGHRLSRGAGDATATMDAERVRREFEAIAGTPKRYLWGPGLVVTRKVRFLHAAMRFMLLHPEEVHPIGDLGEAKPPESFAEALSRRTVSWDVASLGVPINQEDLAFVLLTFGYLIPRGMDTWGRRLETEEKEAFLHLWRAIGYLMGLREDLMTDDLGEAAELYAQILRRNRGANEASVVLTNAVMNFVRSYLPTRFGIAQQAPAALIIDQLGHPDAKLIVPPENFAAAQRFLPRLRHATVKLIVRAYYLLRHDFFRHLPVLPVLITTATERASDVMIASWRDSYRRRPFYVPANATTWVRQRQVTPEFERELSAWRQSIFDGLIVAVVLLFVAGFSLAAAVVCAFFWRGLPLEITAGLFVAGAAGGFGIMRYWLPAVARRRPRLDDDQAEDTPPASAATRPAGVA